MNTSTHASRVLDDQPEGPPSPVALERLAVALLVDGKVEAAQALANRMIDAYTERFQWWLGFGYACDAVVGHREAERTRRAWRGR